MNNTNLNFNSERSSALQETLGISETSFNLLSLNCNSVKNIPGINARAAFQVDSSAVFREQGDIVPKIIDDRIAYVSSSGDNQKKNQPFILS